MKKMKKNKRKEVIQKTLNVASPIASVLSLINPAFLAIPVVASVSNELCAYFDAKSVENRLLQLQQRIEEDAIAIEDLKRMVNALNEHSQYVVRNNLKHLCLSALPETTDVLIRCLISYIKEDNRDMDEEICEIICSCNANDIELLQLIKQYIFEGPRDRHREMIKKGLDDAEEKEDQTENSSVGMGKAYHPIRWKDRNIIYGNDTIFWKDFTDYFQLQNVSDMGKILNLPGRSENGEETYAWAYMARSLLKFQSQGVVQLEFVSSLGTISQNNIDRFHITLFGQALLNYVEVEE